MTEMENMILATFFERLAEKGLEGFQYDEKILEKIVENDYIDEETKNVYINKLLDMKNHKRSL